MALNQVAVGPQQLPDSTTPVTARAGKGGETIVSEFMPRYYEMMYRGKLFTATALVTAPVIFSTAAGTGGPLLWNPSALINIVPIAVGFSTSVVTTVAGGVGLAWGGGQTVVPTTTTAIDFNNTNNLLGGAAPVAKAFRLGTVLTAAPNFLPFAQVHTGALTVDTTGLTWVDLGGIIAIPQFGFVSFGSGSATLSTLVLTCTAVWAEVPV